MSIILGIDALPGDSFACIVRHAELVKAAEEGRFRRNKHWIGFPVEVIK